MLHSKSFARKTKKGNVLKVRRHHERLCVHVICLVSPLSLAAREEGVRW